MSAKSGGGRSSTELIDDILAEAQADYLGLWWILRKVDQYRPELSGRERQEFTLRLLEDLLRDTRLVAGDVQQTDPEFIPRAGEPAEIIRQVRVAWDDLRGEPDLGDVVWFAAPDR